MALKAIKQKNGKSVILDVIFWPCGILGAPVFGSTVISGAIFGSNCFFIFWHSCFGA